MPTSCDDCEHRGPHKCHKGRVLFPPRCGWFVMAYAKRDQEAEWEREAEEWEAEADE